MMVRQDESVVNQRLKANRELGQHSSEVGGRSFSIFPSVFSPEVNSSTGWASSLVPARLAPKAQGTSMLEIGTGCGAIGILSALDGCPRVVVTDVNPEAVECAHYNAKVHGIDEKMDFIVSDIYRDLPPEQFDVIFWNFPFNYPKDSKSLDQMDYCEKSLWDPGYKLLGRYLAEARNHLKPNAHLYITFSPDTGNVQRFTKLTTKHEWEPVLFASREVEAMGASTAAFHLYYLHDKTKAPNLFGGS